MKKAVIQTGSKQYLVTEGETLAVELVKPEGEKLTLEALLVIDGDRVQVGTPFVASAAVTAEIVSEDIATEKIVSVRFKAKKRVHKVHGHRQHKTLLKIVSIS